MTTATKSNGATPVVLEGATNAAASLVQMDEPYNVIVTIEGTSKMLFHAWSCDAIEEQSKAKKGSVQKKTDNLESYVYRVNPEDHSSEIGIPGQYLLAAICNKQTGAAKYLRDPRSSRASAISLYRAGVVCLTEIAPIGKTTWDFIDRRRVTVNMAGITRQRPGFNQGWRATFELGVLTPEYISPMDLHSVLSQAGRLVGLADLRPTYGRFAVVGFDVVRDE